MPGPRGTLNWEDTLQQVGAAPLIGKNPDKGEPTDCEGYGADPNNSAAANTAAIQSALNVGGIVTLTRPGTYQVTALPTIASASLTLGNGVIVSDGKGSYSGPRTFPFSGPRDTLQNWSKARRLKRFIDTVGVTVTNSGTAATVSIDASSPFGRPALKVAMPAGNTFCEIELTGLSLAAFDQNVVWSLWMSDYTAIQQVVAFAGTTAYGRLYQTTYNVNNSNLARWNGEHKVIVGPVDATAAATFVRGVDTLAATKVRIFPGAAGGDVWIDAAYVPAPVAATHLITHDDCSVTWMSNALPNLAANGLRGVFSINTDAINTSPTLFLSSAQIAEISAANHEICCHNISNTPFNDGTGGTQTAAQYTADFVTACATLSGIVGARLYTGFHPWVQGRNNQTVHDTMRAAGMVLARGANHEGYVVPQAGLGNGILALRHQALHTKSQANITAICDNAALYGLTVVWMVHEITASGGAGVETAVANYQFLCSRIAQDVSKGVAQNLVMSEFAQQINAQGLLPAALRLN